MKRNNSIFLILATCLIVGTVWWRMLPVPCTALLETIKIQATANTCKIDADCDSITLGGDLENCRGRYCFGAIPVKVQPLIQEWSHRCMKFGSIDCPIPENVEVKCVVGMCRFFDGRSAVGQTGIRE